MALFQALATRLLRHTPGYDARRLRAFADQTGALEPAFQAMSDEALAGQTPSLRQRLGQGATLDDVLPEAFATVREATRRRLGIRHFDVQIMAGAVLHRGDVAEMQTGEGKTLVVPLAAYLNALDGKGVHVFTANGYLARRDAEWMGAVYRFLGLSVGAVVPGLSRSDRRAAYAGDIVYGTSSEIGFDYLRDNMCLRPEDIVQRPFGFAILDEIDSILLEGARTPLLISGAADDASELYRTVDRLIPQLAAEDYDIDERLRIVALTEVGNDHIEALLRGIGLIAQGGLYDRENVGLVFHVNQALRAHLLFARDDRYVVQGDKVVLVDRATGRPLPGRRFTEGLHQAIEAKEGVPIHAENRTLASVTLQNFFRLYPKLGGLTGTVGDAAEEFEEVYGLRTVVIPTNLPVARSDQPDEVFRTTAEKIEAIAGIVEDCIARRQPVLVGTASIGKSEALSRAFKEKGIEHTVLNARRPEAEACIVAQAGRPGAVTIATDMAGRGTDIRLGGDAEARIRDSGGDPAFGPEKAEQIRAEVEVCRGMSLSAGGLFVIGAERHESRRMDDQLRGRSGRQGDPGRSKFFLSLEDDLMKRSGANLGPAFLLLGPEAGKGLSGDLLDQAIARAQHEIETQQAEVRAKLLTYDNVLNEQRGLFYQVRAEVLLAEDAGQIVGDMRRQVIGDLVARFTSFRTQAIRWNAAALRQEIVRILRLDLPLDAWFAEDGMGQLELVGRIVEADVLRSAQKIAGCQWDALKTLEKNLLLTSMNAAWADHLAALDDLRQSVKLRGYAKQVPLTEYRREAFEMYGAMLTSLRETVVSEWSKLEIRKPEAVS